MTRQMHGRGSVTIGRPPGSDGAERVGVRMETASASPAPTSISPMPETAPRAQPDRAMSTIQVAAIWMNALRSQRPDQGTIRRTSPASTR